MINMNDWFEKQMKQEELKNKFKENIHQSANYIAWLEEFTNKYNIFSNDDFEEDETISEKDKNNIFLLEALFEEIHDYADENYITPESTEFGEYYSIQHNGIGYDIGHDYGQGTFFYCKRQDKPRKNSLEYKQLMSTVKLPSTVQADYKLEGLQKFIEQLIEDNVPLEAIARTTDTIIQRVKIKKRDY